MCDVCLVLSEHLFGENLMSSSVSVLLVLPLTALFLLFLTLDGFHLIEMKSKQRLKTEIVLNNTEKDKAHMLMLNDQCNLMVEQNGFFLR